MDTQSTQQGIPRTVIHLGWSMFFINLSFIMIYCLSAIYLQQQGVSTQSMGKLEGLAEAISQIMKFASGFLSDFMRKRKFWIVLGFGVSFLSRPVIAFSSSYPVYFFGRVLERFGNGFQATPRDALVGDCAPKGKRGSAFGLMRSMGVFGSILGCVIAYLILNHVENADITFVFKMTILPAFIGFIVVLFFVKEPPIEHTDKPKKRFNWASLRELSVDFYLLMLVNVFFMLSRINEQFFIRYGFKEFSISGGEVPLIMAIYNITYTLSSYPIGFLADRTNRFFFLAGGVISLILASLVFSKATSTSEFWMAVLLWGVQMGITTNVFTSLIVIMVPRHIHGTAFGVFYLLNAGCLFSADWTAGALTHFYGASSAFLYSASMGAISLVILMVVMKYRDFSIKY